MPDFEHRAFLRAKEDVNAAALKLDEMRRAKTFSDLDRHWSEFLSLLQRIYNRLGKACQGGPSSAWYGRLKHERGTDDLLTYVQHARHADEHGIDKITRVFEDSVQFTSQGSSHIRGIKIVNGEMVIEHTGSPVDVVFEPGAVALLPVVNRGVTYQPPTEHLGVPLGSPATCITVAIAAFVYFRSKCNEAEVLFATGAT